jgi:hypothetical protein
MLLQFIRLIILFILCTWRVKKSALRYAVVLPVIFFNYVFTIHSFD